ncbi:MAG: prohibitin family protein [Thermoplasmata archaeon]|nr:prohibitin family protein [Thermoplasmata archaeon]
MIDAILFGIGLICLTIAAIFIVGSAFLSAVDPNVKAGEKRSLMMKGVGLAVLGIVLITATSLVTIIPAGAVGIRDTFGVVDKDVFNSGLYLKNPFTNVIMMSYQTQKYYDPSTGGDKDVATIEGLSNEGLLVTMGIAVNYHIEPNKAPDLYRTVGTAYSDVVMKPPIHSVPRDIISKYDVKTLYSAGRDINNPDRARIEQELLEGVSKGVLDATGQNRGIVVERVFLRDVKPPQALLDSITAKLQMEQQIAQKSFEVQVAQKEADRKVAEAQGIANANKIIANSLSQSYLEWYTIEMMKEHTGATYFIPIGADGRYHPEAVIPIASNPT